LEGGISHLQGSGARKASGGGRVSQGPRCLTIRGDEKESLKNCKCDRRAYANSKKREGGSIAEGELHHKRQSLTEKVFRSMLYGVQLPKRNSTWGDRAYSEGGEIAQVGQAL